MKISLVKIKGNKGRFTYYKEKECDVDGFVYNVKDNLTGDEWHTLIFDDVKEWCLTDDRERFEREHGV